MQCEWTECNISIAITLHDIWVFFLLFESFYILHRSLATLHCNSSWSLILVETMQLVSPMMLALHLFNKYVKIKQTSPAKLTLRVHAPTFSFSTVKLLSRAGPQQPVLDSTTHLTHLLAVANRGGGREGRRRTKFFIYKWSRYKREHYACVPKKASHIFTLSHSDWSDASRTLDGKCVKLYIGVKGWTEVNPFPVCQLPPLIAAALQVTAWHGDSSSIEYSVKPVSQRWL